MVSVASLWHQDTVVKEFQFSTELWLPCPRAELFTFFADPTNLQEITPSWLQFEILTPMPVTMKPGLLLDYRIRVHRFPLHWRTEITEWDPPHQFVDIQLKGPYKLWHHTHRFIEQGGGTLCTDQVRYWPLGGALTNRLFVRRDIERIFQHRHSRMQILLGTKPSVQETPQP
jgi:ligand-binding SRPBCC domain-containing protein